MISELERRNIRRKRRSFSVRNHVKGNAGKPRLSVSKTNSHIFAQLIDDEKGVTLVCAGTMMKQMRDQKLGRKSKTAAKQVGALLAQLAKKQQIEKVVFDRGHYKYHGILAELANGAREAGLQF